MCSELIGALSSSAGGRRRENLRDTVEVEVSLELPKSLLTLDQKSKQNAHHSLHRCASKYTYLTFLTLGIPDLSVGKSVRSAGYGTQTHPLTLQQRECT